MLLQNVSLKFLILKCNFNIVFIICKETINFHIIIINFYLCLEYVMCNLKCNSKTQLLN